MWPASSLWMAAMCRPDAEHLMPTHNLLGALDDTHAPPLCWYLMPLPLTATAATVPFALIHATVAADTTSSIGDGLDHSTRVVSPRTPVYRPVSALTAMSRVPELSDTTWFHCAVL